MTTKKILSLASAAVLAGVFLTSSATAATTIVNWGGDYVSTNQEFSNKFSLGYGGFDENGNAESLAPTSGYTGGNFSGAILKEGAAALSQLNSVTNATAGDNIFLKVQTGSAASFLVLWNQPDFIDGQSGNVSFDSTSSLYLNLSNWAGGHSTDSGRVVLRLSDGNYYVSSQLFTGKGATTLNGSQLLNLDFFNYDPVSSLNLDAGSLTSAIISDGEFINGITSVGFYFEATEAANRFDIQNFTVVATAIPEPSTYAVIAGVLGLGIAVLRRRRK